jgi:hypothetical protein
MRIQPKYGTLFAQEVVKVIKKLRRFPTEKLDVGYPFAEAFCKFEPPLIDFARKHFDRRIPERDVLCSVANERTGFHEG